MMFLNKMLTRKACVERYGAIDFASRHWPEMSSWIQLFEVPKGEFPCFTIMDTGIPVTHISCNRDMIKPLTDAFDNIIYRNLQKELITYDGCFNIRPVRGYSNLFSAHSYGLAIDLNAATNPLGRVGNMSPELGACFVDSGFDWGRNFHRQDSQHFSFCFEGEERLEGNT